MLSFLSTPSPIKMILSCLMILPALVATRQTLAFQSAAPCFTRRHFGSMLPSCAVSPGFVRPGSCSQRRFWLNQSSDNSNDGTAEKAKKDLQSAATFVAMKLQMIAITKALEEEASGGGEKSAKIMESIEKMMQPPKTKTEKEEKSRNAPKTPAEPATSSSKETKSDAATEKKPPIGLKRSSSGTGELPPKPAEKKAQQAPKIEIPPATPKAAKAAAPASLPIEEKAVPATAKDSAPKTTATTEKASSTSSRTGLIPSCISTDFGQALPTIVEDLPALRDPLAAGAAPAVQTPEKKVAPPEEEKAPAKEPVITPPAPGISASDALERMASTPFPSVDSQTPDDKASSTEGKSDSKDKAKPKAIVTPPPKIEDKSEGEDKRKEEEKPKAIVPPPPPPVDKAASDSKKEEQEEAVPKAIITPPPADDVESNEKIDEKKVEPRTLVTPPPPSEKKADDTSDSQKEKTPKALVTPPPKEDNSSDKDDTAATSNATGTKSSTALDSVAVKSKTSATATSPNTSAFGNADRYASMSLGDRAFAILKDLGMIEITPDPDDPDYDQSNDDELCAENVWKDSKL